MKAPDKIYLPGDIDWPSAAILTLGNQPGDVEYIRKDALLEWAKDLKHLYEMPINNHQASELCCAKAKAFQIVIEKIESL